MNTNCVKAAVILIFLVLEIGIPRSYAGCLATDIMMLAARIQQPGRIQFIKGTDQLIQLDGPLILHKEMFNDIFRNKKEPSIRSFLSRTGDGILMARLSKEVFIKFDKNSREMVIFESGVVLDYADIISENKTAGIVGKNHQFFWDQLTGSAYLGKNPINFTGVSDLLFNSRGAARSHFVKHGAELDVTDYQDYVKLANSVLQFSTHENSYLVATLDRNTSQIRMSIFNTELNAVVAMSYTVGLDVRPVLVSFYKNTGNLMAKIAANSP